MLWINELNIGFGAQALELPPGVLIAGTTISFLGVKIAPGLRNKIQCSLHLLAPLVLFGFFKWYEIIIPTLWTSSTYQTRSLVFSKFLHMLVFDWNWPSLLEFHSLEVWSTVRLKMSLMLPEYLHIAPLNYAVPNLLPHTPRDCCL